MPTSPVVYTSVTNAAGTTKLGQGTKIAFVGGALAPGADRYVAAIAAKFLSMSPRKLDRLRVTVLRDTSIAAPLGWQQLGERVEALGVEFRAAGVKDGQIVFELGRDAP